MVKERTFDFVLVGKDTPKGFDTNPVPDKTVQYNGTQLKINR